MNTVKLKRAYQSFLSYFLLAGLITFAPLLYAG